jgi:nicotinate phosphoribosyltransferase
MLHKYSLALLTDFYQMTMSYGYWKMGLDKREAVFHLFFRKPPFQGGFTVAAGLESAIDYLKNFSFDNEDLNYLKTLKDATGERLLEDKFLDYLAHLKFTCDVDAVKEGTIVFPYEPLLRIKGPLIQCQILESSLLNLINFPSLIATKAARIRIAAKGDAILEFGLRRAQGVDGALTASRSAFIGGCTSTSNLLAGKIYGIPVQGTHSHSWIMVFDEEIEAFKTFAKALPDSCVFLVDTYDTIDGVKKAIVVGNWLKEKGKKLLGIRLDSGDLAYLSIKSRKLLDEAGFHDAKIFASNELDEVIISELKRQGAQIAVWGVGTNLVTAKDQPALDGVYKLSAIREEGKPWKYKLKLSEQMLKISTPGILQVKRYSYKGKYVADAIYNIETELKKPITIVDPLDPTQQKILTEDLEEEDLLVPIFRKGECVYTLPPLNEISERTQQELHKFHVGIKRFLNPHKYVVGLEKSLYELKTELVTKYRKDSSQAYISDETI